MTHDPLPWSLRYKQLVLDGAREKHLPAPYVAFLDAMPHYRRPLLDLALMSLVAPLFLGMHLTWMLLSLARGLMPGSMLAPLLKLFLRATAWLSPWLWALHDCVPGEWRGTDALGALPTGRPGEWYSSRQQRATHATAVQRGATHNGHAKQRAPQRADRC